MPLHLVRVVANGLRTDHPVPDVPFVDDSHIPVDDPQAIAAIGRRPGGETWGRQDALHGDGWVAFTTDPVRHDLAWCVRWHPEHGRSVLVYRDADSPAAHTAFWGPALLFRSGGYWWDGATWFRPSQVWDTVNEEYVARPAPGASSVTAADLLVADTSGAGRGRILTITDVDPDAGPCASWQDDLNAWAARRPPGSSQVGCVVRVSAPELAADQLLGPAELAAIAGIAPSTLRGYIARGQGDVPAPQAVVGGRSLWARRVAEEWVEQRDRSPEGLTATVSKTRGKAAQPAGIIDVWDRYTRIFLSTLWERPDRRRRWALRWRTPEAVREVAEQLSWSVAAGLAGSSLVPWDTVANTLCHALIDELAISKELATGPFERYSYAIGPDVSRMLEWVILHNPVQASHAISMTVHEAERRLGIPRAVIERSLREADTPEGLLDPKTRDEFFDQVLVSSDPASS
ncbi:hypothetical protein [Pseudofrankia sp. BMG5.37]|uniref:helix-turn-helix transcriptional regulator n=1 Tax=Pseudofrankia sp. BMG5.37 TaxID=3050035 RepID=UPI00289520C0|nr:hypothetical protein [Pseudofrankia sp. BMG5.37]MDT3445278.1 hypothetical protein [Pseudofrankia sp. BMG5.37]